MGPCDLEIWCKTSKTIGHLLYTMLNLGQNRQVYFVPCDLEVWQMTLKNNMAPLLCSFKLCVSFYSLLWNQNEVTVRKKQIWVKIGDLSCRVTLKFDRWPCKNNRAPLLCYFMLSASFNSHLWIQNGVTVRKRYIWVKIGDFFVPCDLQICQMTLKNNRTPFLW